MGRPRGDICRHGERCDRERVTVALADVAALPSGRPFVANKISGGRLPLRFCAVCSREWAEARAGIARLGCDAPLRVRVDGEIATVEVRRG